MELWKRELAEAGAHPKLIVVDTSTPDGWHRAERAWIRHGRSLGSILNIHEGGIIKPKKPSRAPTTAWAIGR
jgi:hypothetical protein